VKIAITGAAGFIGQALCAELDSAGHDVIGTDQFGSERASEWVGEYIDLLDEQTEIGGWLDRHSPDVVVHLAAHVGRIFGEDDRSHTVRMNAEATALLAAACGERGIRMVYASSSEVYGDQGRSPIDEDYTEWRTPYNLYGLSKGWGEQACQLYAPDGLVIVRLSMPYGPGVPPGRGRRAMDTMLWQAIHRQPITVHRGAERSWCWVGDTVRGIRLAMESGSEPGRYSAYNVGRDDDPRSMLEIAQMACKLAGASDNLIQEIDPPADQIAVKRLSMDKLRGLGWAPTVDLEDGMKAVFDWVSGFDKDGNRPTESPCEQGHAPRTFRLWGGGTQTKCVRCAERLDTRDTP
jgi:nucleoside-diphosphate-sugar epimerase